MTDVVLSSFISLFALFGKEEQVDEAWAKDMLISYLRHHFGIRNIDLYLDLYTDMRGAYEMTDNLNTQETVAAICSSLHGKIRPEEESLLLLRLMEFCSDDGLKSDSMFTTMAEKFNIPQAQYDDFYAYVTNQPTAHVMIHHPEGFDGELKTLMDNITGLLIFTYMGDNYGPAE